MYFALFCVAFLFLNNVCCRLVPFTPCGKLFNYWESETHEIFGSMTFKNDLSGEYHLKVTMSIGMKTDKNISIFRKTPEYKIRNGEGIEYYVRFPYNHTFPLLTEVVFNGKVYCVGPGVTETETRPVTELSAKDDLSTTIVSGLLETASERNPKPPTIIIPVYLTVNCGQPDSSAALVINGLPTKSGEYPWLVAMIYYDDSKDQYQFRCAGSLISDSFVISAAHCVKNNGITLDKNSLTIVLGKHNIRNWATRSTLRDVQRVHVHPDYTAPSDADIAVIKLSAPVQFTTTIKPVCLWDETDNLQDVVGKDGTVVGWGKDEHGNQFVEEPKQLKVPIVSHEGCLRSDERFLKLTSNRTFCAGKTDGSGPCTGDSGGPFVMKRGKKWMLRGIVSAALLDANTRSCDTNKYSVYTDVPKYMNWILQVLAE